MTWIRTIPKTEADAAYLAAMRSQHALYPKEYEEEVPACRVVTQTGSWPRIA